MVTADSPVTLTSSRTKSSLTTLFIHKMFHWWQADFVTDKVSLTSSKGSVNKKKKRLIMNPLKLIGRKTRTFNSIEI